MQETQKRDSTITALPVIPTAVTKGANRGATRRIRRQSVSAECSKPFTAVQLPTVDIKTHIKTPAEEARIKEAMDKSFLFANANLNSFEKQKVINVMFQKEVDEGAVIIQQGKEGDYFYILYAGTCDVYVNEEKVLTYQAGSSFGELALMYNCPRAATVQSVTKCSLFLLDRQTFRFIVSSAQMEKKRRLDGFLQACSLFKTLNKTEIVRITDVMMEQEFNKCDIIIREGDEDYENMKFYIILEGAAVAFKMISKDVLERNSSTSPRRMTEPPTCLEQVNLLATSGESTHQESLRNHLNVVQTVSKVRHHTVVGVRMPGTAAIVTPKPPEEVKPSEKCSPRTKQLEANVQIGSSTTASFKVNDKTLARKTVKEGEAIEQIVGNMGVGQFFGEEALIERKPRAASVRVVSDKLICGVLDVASFERLFGNCNDLLNREIKKYEEVNKQFFGIGEDGNFFDSDINEAEEEDRNDHDERPMAISASPKSSMELVKTRSSNSNVTFYENEVFESEGSVPSEAEKIDAGENKLLTSELPAGSGAVAARKLSLDGSNGNVKKHDQVKQIVA